MGRKKKVEEPVLTEEKVLDEQAGESGDVNLTLSELRDVARGKAVMMMKEVQELTSSNLLVKAEIPEKFILCFQCLAECLILEERIFSELVDLVGDGASTGLFDQFREFSDQLTGAANESDSKEPADSAVEEPEPLSDEPLSNETIQADVSGIPVEITSEVSE